MSKKPIILPPLPPEADVTVTTAPLTNADITISGAGTPEPKQAWNVIWQEAFKLNGATDEARTLNQTAEPEVFRALVDTAPMEPTSRKDALAAGGWVFSSSMFGLPEKPVRFVRLHSEGATATGRYVPPSLMVRWEDGSCGDAIREAQDLLRAEVEAAGQRVTGWDIGGVELDKERGDPKTPGHSKRLIGYEEGNINKPVVASVTHVRRLVTPKVDLEAKLEERWLRLTSASGPCAVEMLTTRGGQVVDRAKLHPEDMRDISVRKAERALQEFGG